MSRLFGKAVHAAFVVPDIKAAMQEVIDDGIGPFYLMDHITPDARYRGTRNNPCISAAFVNSGDMQFEFIQPHDDTPSAFREFLERKPEGGLHHIAYWVDDIGDAVKDAQGQGFACNTVQEFVHPDGTAYEIYLEPLGKPEAKLIQIMVDSPVKAFFEGVRQAAESWDGSNPVRDALELLGPEMDLRPA